METLFVITFLFWWMAALDVGIHGRADEKREFWHSTDPTLIAEGLFVLAAIMTSCRAFMPLSLNYYLGPFYVSTYILDG